MQKYEKRLGVIWPQCGKRVHNLTIVNFCIKCHIATLPGPSTMAHLADYLLTSPPRYQSELSFCMNIDIVTERQDLCCGVYADLIHVDYNLSNAALCSLVFLCEQSAPNVSVNVHLPAHTEIIDL